jgi:hypothetical protein
VPPSPRHQRRAPTPHLALEAETGRTVVTGLVAPLAIYVVTQLVQAWF